ncbi:hypothetical protein L1987_30837 [Smallanthus sonchifolius]|uniref:Uncharacterized protein n=1 Tax=Smallanthus sonchifolius TaxID=185202 RepID=A0ACB9I584_9ASTR|nr:hypothetical protein L1987_30837 [Smallanthus sonchifolius]
MEVTVEWCNSGFRSRIRRQFKIDNHVFITVSVNIGLQTPIWRVSWRKMKKEKKKKKVKGVSNSTQFSYDPCEYAQNFDQGLMLNDHDDLSRSFSARFAVPSTVFPKGLLVD